MYIQWILPAHFYCPFYKVLLQFFPESFHLTSLKSYHQQMFSFLLFILFLRSLKKILNRPQQRSLWGFIKNHSSLWKLTAHFDHIPSLLTSSSSMWWCFFLSNSNFVYLRVIEEKLVDWFLNHFPCICLSDCSEHSSFSEPFICLSLLC